MDVEQDAVELVDADRRHGLLAVVGHDHFVVVAMALFQQAAIVPTVDDVVVDDQDSPDGTVDDFAFGADRITNGCLLSLGKD